MCHARIRYWNFIRGKNKTVNGGHNSVAGDRQKFKQLVDPMTINDMKKNNAEDISVQ